MPAARHPALAPALRGNRSLSSEELDLSAHAVEAFATALGGRAALTDALVVASGTPEVDKVANFLIDTRYAGWSLRRICHQAGITVADLFIAYRKAVLVQAHIAATRLVSQQLVGVVADVMARSAPHLVTCPDCNGIGQVTADPTEKIPNPSPQPCKACNGTTTLLELPDLDRQKVALELGQLLTKSGGISISQNNLSLPAAGSATGGSLESLQQAMQAILYPRLPAAQPAVCASVVEGEAIPVPLPETGGD